MKKRTSNAQQEKLTGLMFVSPWLFGFITLTALPMLLSLALMFMKWDFLRPPAWAGLQNFVDLFEKRAFPMALSNTLKFTGAVTVLHLVLQLLVAAALAGKLPGRNVFRIIFYIPGLVIGTAFGFMMLPVFGNGRLGLVSGLLIRLGFPEQQWLITPGLAIWVMVFTSIWLIGGGMIVFLAGIKGIDQTYYEAAEIDGAGTVRKFFNVTLPLIMPVITFQAVMAMIWAVQVFDVPLALAFGNGNNMGTYNSLATLVYMMYNLGFKDFYIGQAAILGWMVFGISLILCLLLFRLFKRFDYLGD